MAGALVGRAFLSSFIEVVLERLISPETVNLAAGKNLGPELVERLRNALGATEVLLVDAERKQFDNRNVRNWLNSLRDAIYKTDDMLDHVFTKTATRKEVDLKEKLSKKKFFIVTMFGVMIDMPGIILKSLSMCE